MVRAFASRGRRRRRRQPQARGLRRGRRGAAVGGDQGCRVRVPRRPVGRARAARRGGLRASSAGSTCSSTTPACRRIYGQLSEVTEELFDKVIGVNLKGPFRLAALVGERMVAAGGGSIINVSSTGAVRPTRDIVPYAAAKAGVNAMTVGLAHAFGPTVRVNADHAGAVPHDDLARLGHGAVRRAGADVSPPARRTVRGDRRGGAVPGQRRLDATRRVRSSPSTAALNGAWPAPATAPRSLDLKSTHLRDSVGFVMPANQPLWLRVVLRVERAIGEPVESAVRSDIVFRPDQHDDPGSPQGAGRGGRRLAPVPAHAEPAGRIRHPQRAPAAGADGTAAQPAVRRGRGAGGAGPVSGRAR